MEYPQRKPNRLRDFDYGVGAYFVTICTHDRKNLFWKEYNVGADIIRPLLSDCGKVVEHAILSISEHYPNVTVEQYVVMPNHVHLILQIRETDGRMISAPTLSTVIGMMKRSVTKRLGYPVWQKSFHDHVIRNETDYLEIAQYIENNPAKWAEDPVHNRSGFP